MNPMQPIPFIAESAEDAVTQIRERLGPEAVVVHVRPLPANGLAKLWQKPMIEVLAYKPEIAAAVAEAAISPDALAEVRQQLQEIKAHVAHQIAASEKSTNEFAGESLAAVAASADPVLRAGNWRIGGILKQSGLLPLHAQFVLDQLRAQHGETPPASLGDEIGLARQLLASVWRKARPLSSSGVHVFVGPAGVGKTTILCKWLTQTSLMEGRAARVWRLDGATANTAESLSVYCEILGIACERVWESGTTLGEEIAFIDLPGVDWRNAIAVKELAGQIKQFGLPHVHLALNGAYDTATLLAQVRAFTILPIEDIAVTHLDEESRWGKLWNLALGTNYPIRHFSTGQNIPGDFREASPELIFAHQFPRK
jgi:flagellar biosynthesis protein FlhF